MRLASKQKKGFDESLSEAICFLVLEKSFPLSDLRRLEIDAFMVLLDFIEGQIKEQQKMENRMKRGKNGK